MYCIPYLFYGNLLKITTLRPGNLKQNQGVLSWLCGGGWPEVPVRDKQQKHGVLIPHCDAKTVAWGEGKERQMSSFLSLHGNMPGTGLQEIAFHNPEQF